MFTREIFLATCFATFVARQVARKIASCNMALRCLALIGDFTNQNATHPETSPEVICSQGASLRMLGAELQRVFFTFRTRGLHLQRFQKA